MSFAATIASKIIKIQVALKKGLKIKMKRDEWMLNGDSIDFKTFEKPTKKIEIQKNIERETREEIIKERTIKPLSTESVDSQRKYEFGDKGSNWRMMKLKRVYEIAKETNQKVEVVALERFGVKLF